MNLQPHTDEIAMSPLFCVPTHATPPAPNATLAGSKIASIKLLAFRLDAWLALRKKTAADLRELAGMSDRERLDIGLPPLHTRDADAWWPAGYPR